MSIIDHESFATWLEVQPREIVLAIGVRASLRNFPLSLSNPDPLTSKFPNQILSWLFRSNLIAHMAARNGVAVYSLAAHNAYAVRSEIQGVIVSNILTEAALVVCDLSQATSDSSKIISNHINYSTPVGLMHEMVGDADYLDSGVEVTTLVEWPIWKDKFESTELWPYWLELKGFLERSEINWSFWIDWYQRILDGRPQNWDMLKEIALIDPEDWDKGAEHVNGLIAKIQARYAVKETVEVAREVLEQRPVAALGIGHNNPPEDIEDDPFSAQDAAFVQKILDDIGAETESSQPDVSRLRVAYEGLGQFCRVIGVGLAKIAKVPVATFLGTLGTSAALKVDGPLFAYLMRLLEALQPVIDALTKWLPFIGG